MCKLCKINYFYFKISLWKYMDNNYCKIRIAVWSVYRKYTIYNYNMMASKIDPYLGSRSKYNTGYFKSFLNINEILPYKAHMVCHIY